MRRDISSSSAFLVLRVTSAICLAGCELEQVSRSPLELGLLLSDVEIVRGACD